MYRPCCSPWTERNTHNLTAIALGLKGTTQKLERGYVDRKEHTQSNSDSPRSKRNTRLLEREHMDKKENTQSNSDNPRSKRNTRMLERDHMDKKEHKNARTGSHGQKGTHII